MPIVYLEPGDLSLPQAEQVLAFLNRATSAGQLARDIEFPNEPDIGVRLGQRLLDARAALGGAFTQIAQVRAVRLIGPERFTEICVAALGLDPRRWVELFYGAAPMAPQSESGLVVALELRPQPAWLGQPLAVGVSVRDKGGSPRVGVPVALHTGVGRLVAMFGFTRSEGEAVTVLTGADGTAELELVLEPSEPLSEVQQAALETALAGLDVDAADPQKLNAAFAQMVQVYLQERSYNLRRAVDIWVRDQRAAMVDSVNASRWAFRWPMVTALLQADVLSGEGGGSSLARGVATAAWKNWVGAWLLALDAHLREQGRIDEAIGHANQAGDARLLGQLLGQAQRFVAAQPGLAAEWLGRKQVQAATTRLVSSDLTKLGADAQADVLTQLEVAAAEVRPTSLGSYTLVTKTRKDIGKQLFDLGALNAGQLAQFQGLAAQLQQQAAQVGAQLTQIDGLAAGLRGDRAAVEQQLAAFNQQREQLLLQIGQVSQLANQLRDTGAAVNSQVAQFNADLAAFNRSSVQLGTRIEGLQADLGRINTRIDLIAAPRQGPGGPKK